MQDFINHLDTVEASLNVKLNSMKKYNIIVGGKRTSITLEPIIWEVLHDIADQQKCTIHDICDFINARKKDGANLCSAIRVFLLSYLFIQHKKGLPNG